MKCDAQKYIRPIAQVICKACLVSYFPQPHALSNSAVCCFTNLLWPTILIYGFPAASWHPLNVFDICIILGNSGLHAA